jgi:type II secretory ATPase GspE/PulE/Tfp pilus assembly ATPase PilB-like protein
VALRYGMSPLRANGAQLVLRGITTSAEVLRVTRGYEGE